MNLQLLNVLSEAGSEPIRDAEFLFALSRRHGLPFSVVALRVRAVPLDLGGVSRAEGESSIADEHIDEHIEKRICALIRNTDVLVQHAGAGRYMAFCAGADGSGVSELALRLEHGIEGVRIATGCASFGVEALTLGNLIDVAWSKVSRTPEASKSDDDWGGGGRLRRIDHRRGRPLIPDFQSRLSARIKRIFDVAVVTITAPLWLPALAIVAIAVKLSDLSAPLYFVQMRTGQGGRRFRMYKFRTMVPNAEGLKEELLSDNELIWPDFKIKHDPRVTSIGRLLRKTSLDEIPQVLNVLKGDMSLVGPRPTSFEANTYEPWQTARLDAPAGLTGLWQVEGRASSRFDERIRIELEYIERQSLLLDLWILIRTVPAVFKMRGGH